MKVGKVSELILNRSVFKLFRHRRKEVAHKPTSGVDATKINVGKEELCISTNPVMLDIEQLGNKAIYYVANNIACVGGELIGVVVNILMPACSDEKDIKKIMNDLEDECAKLNIEVMGGHTEMTESVNKTLVTITGIGRIVNAVKNDNIESDKASTKYNNANNIYNLGNLKAIQEGYEIVMVKWAGMNGASIIAKNGENELRTRLGQDLIDRAIDLQDDISLIKEANIAKNNGAFYMHDITKGGVFAGLWELSSAIKKGIEVDIKKIPIRQEIIEVCEFFDINPYNLDSRGALLVVTDCGEKLVEELAIEGIEAAVIGYVAGHKNKLVHNDDEVRYLESPSSDEIYSFLDKDN